MTYKKLVLCKELAKAFGIEIATVADFAKFYNSIRRATLEVAQ